MKYLNNLLQMPNNLVSIIIPCHNSASFVSRAVESALNQSHHPTEILLIDNNSSDNTLEILERYESENPEIIRVLREFRKGSAAARNKGLKDAKGEWIQFLDADDKLLPGKIERQINLALNQNGKVIIGNYLKYANNRYLEVHAITDPWTGLIRSKLGITSSNLWSKGVLQSIGGWNENIISSQEYHLLFEIIKRDTVLIFDPAFNTIIYTQPNSISKSDDTVKRSMILENNLMLRAEIKDYLMRNDFFSDQIRLQWDKHIYSMITWNKYTAPQFYRKFSGQFEFNLPYLYRLRKKIGTELRRLF